MRTSGVPTPTRATSPPSYPSGCVRSLVAGATVATATIQLLAEPASALDLDSDGGLITETVASRDRDELLVHDIDLEMVREIRNKWQFFRDRRPETYEALVELN